MNKRHCKGLSRGYYSIYECVFKATKHYSHSSLILLIIISYQNKTIWLIIELLYLALGIRNSTKSHVLLTLLYFLWSIFSHLLGFHFGIYVHMKAVALVYIKILSNAYLEKLAA